MDLSSVVSMFSAGAEAPGTRSPDFGVTVSGGGGSGLGGLLGAVTSALGAASAPDPWKEHVTRITVRRGCAPRIDTMEIDLLDDASTPQAAIEDTLDLTLGFADSGMNGVFSGTICSLGNHIAGRKQIGAASAGAILAALRLNQSYESMNCGAIVKDLAGKAGVTVANVEDGLGLQSYVLDDRANVLVHIARLALLCGFWAFTGADGKLNFTAVSPGSPVRSFTYGKDSVRVERHETSGYLPAWEIKGEGAASKKGKEAWYWPVKDISALTTAVKDGGGRVLYLGGLRDSTAVRQVGGALAVHDEQSSVRGMLLVTGEPLLEIGDTIELLSFPQADLNGKALVKEICHRYTKQGGFITEIGFCKAAGGP